MIFNRIKSLMLMNALISKSISNIKAIYKNKVINGTFKSSHNIQRLLDSPFLHCISCVLSTDKKRCMILYESKYGMSCKSHGLIQFAGFDGVQYPPFTQLNVVILPLTVENKSLHFTRAIRQLSLTTFDIRLVLNSKSGIKQPFSQSDQ